MDPIPTPLAPAARARGAVTSLSPEAHMTGIETARDIANAVGAEKRYRYGVNKFHRLNCEITIRVVAVEQLQVNRNSEGSDDKSQSV